MNTKKIKILYLVSTLKRCGPIFVLGNIIKYLDRAKFEPLVLTLSPESQDSMRAYFEDELDTEVNTLGLSRIQGIFFAKKKISYFIKKKNISIVHSHGFRPDYLISQVNNVKKISTLHNYPYYDYKMTYGRFKGYVMAKLHLNCLKNFDTPVVVSESISKMLIKKKYTLSYVRNGADIEKFDGLDKFKMREKLGFKKKEIIFISVGHLNLRKDPITIINAFKQVRKKNVKLIFLGDGPLKQDCINIIKDDDNIYFKGRVKNVNEYLSASDYFISASLAEGLPNTVMEAMASGIPCLLSDIPPHQEIYLLDVHSSKIFKQKNINDCILKFNEIRELDYSIMSNAAKKVARNYLNANKMSLEYQEIYSKLKIESQRKKNSIHNYSL